MGKHSGWAVAAAVLLVNLEHDIDGQKYKALTKDVKRTKLSGLGSKGGKTIDQTLGVDLRESPLFEGDGDGLYWLEDRDKALQNDAVQAALTDYLAWLRENDFLGYWCYHATRNGRLLEAAQQEIAELKHKINALENRKPAE